MKLIKYLLIGIVSLLLLIVAGAFVALQFIDTESLIAKVQEKVKTRTGRNITLSENISVGIGYAGGVAFHPSVTVREVSVSNADWAGSKAMFEAGEASIGVALLPVLSGEVAVDYITLKNATVRLAKSADGKANWEFGTAREGSDKAASDASGSEAKASAEQAKEASGNDDASPVNPALSFDNITLENVILHYTDMATGMNESVVIEGADISGNGELEAAIHASYKELSIFLEAQANSLQEAMAKQLEIVAFRAHGLGAEVNVKGQVMPKAKSVGFSGDVNVTVDDLQALTPLAPGLPASPPMTFSASAQGTPKGASIEEGVLSYGGQNVALKLDADMSGDVPAITFDVRAKRLDVAKVMPQGAAKKATTASTSEASATANETHTLETDTPHRGVIPNIALPLGAVASLPVKLSGVLTIDELVKQSTAFKEIAITANAAPGRAFVKVKPMSVASGTVELNATIDASSATVGSTALELNAVKLNAEELIQLTGNSDPTISDGSLNFFLDLKGAGATLPAMLGNANGSVDLLLNGASYDAPAIESIKAFLTFLGGGKKVEEINIACAFTGATIVNGIAKTDVLTLQTDAAQVDGAGNVSLRDETLNMTLKPRSSLVGITDLVPPLKLSGNWTSPSVSLDEQSTLLSLGKLALGAGTGGLGLALLGGEELVQKSDLFKNNPCVKQAQTAPEQPEQTAPDAALKEVGKAIEGQVKSIRDAFEGKPAEPGAEKKGKEERIMDGLNAVKGLFGQ